MDESTRKLWPIVIVQDRYNGCYSGGAWIAIARAFEMDDDLLHEHTDPPPRRMDWVEEHAHADDVTAVEFWGNPPTWVAVGRSPSEALLALEAPDA